MPFPDRVASRGVLLVGEGAGHGALAAARELTNHGWRVGVATPPGGPVASLRSRSVHRRHVLPDPGTDTDGALAALARLVEADRYDVVLPASDTWLGVLAGAGEPLATRLGLPPADVVRRSLDKVAVVELGAAAGLAVPRTVVADPAAVAAWQGPAVVKVRTHWVPGRGPGRVEAHRADDTGAVRAAVDHAVAQGAVPILQAPVDGRLVGLVGLAVEGRLVQVAMQRADRVWPHRAGVTARAETVVVDPVVRERAEELLEALGWSGPVQLEFLEPPGGSPVLVDVNGRIHGSLALAGAAGLTVPHDWCRWLVDGVAPTPREGRPGVRYLWWEGDVRAALADGVSLSAAVRDARTFGRGAARPLWDPLDPGPGAATAAALLARSLRRVTRGVARPPRVPAG